MKGAQFDAESVRGILADLKDQTRRLTRAENAPSAGREWAECLCREIDPSDTPCVVCEARFGAPAYRPGERLYVKEPLFPALHDGGGGTLADRKAWEAMTDSPKIICYRADREIVRGPRVFNAVGAVLPMSIPWHPWPWKTKHLPAMHCPRWASRLTLEIVSVRAERLQSITEADARAEGCSGFADPTPDGRYATVYRSATAHYAARWDGINGKKPGASWRDDPHVWRIEFRRVT